MSRVKTTNNDEVIYKNILRRDISVIKFILGNRHIYAYVPSTLLIAGATYLILQCTMYISCMFETSVDFQFFFNFHIFDLSIVTLSYSQKVSFWWDLQDDIHLSLIAMQKHSKNWKTGKFSIVTYIGFPLLNIFSVNIYYAKTTNSNLSL